MVGRVVEVLGDLDAFDVGGGHHTTLASANSGQMSW
jgi:hypothetical protein